MVGEQLRRSARQCQQSSRSSDYEMFHDSAIIEEGELVNIALMAEMEPVNLEQAVTNVHWKAAMVDELKSIEKNDNWQLVSLPSKKKTIDVKWVFKTKLKSALIATTIFHLFKN